MSDSEYPFGRTDVTADDLFDLIDLEQAQSIAAAGGVEDSENRIQDFFESIPVLLTWLGENGREYPWRYTTDPYTIYVTEILLQRTRADAVNTIYGEFFEQFPDPEALHEADESDIRDCVRSLGFVNHRTRTLLEVAELICEDHAGDVPDDLDELMQPWRVGPYSARACQVFARGKSRALIDSNFARVVQRVLGYDMPQQPHKSDEVYALLDSLVPSDPAIARSFNLAILDLGALVCTPNRPSCRECPLQTCCYYYEHEVRD